MLSKSISILFTFFTAGLTVSGCGLNRPTEFGDGNEVQTSPSKKEWPLSNRPCEKAANAQMKKFCHTFFARQRSIVTSAQQEYTAKYRSGGICALTQSTALEEAEIVSFIPERPASTLKLELALTTGGTVGSVTYPGNNWVKVKCSELRAGDIVMTKSMSPSNESHVDDHIPFHSFMFVQWADNLMHQAWSLDYHNENKSAALDKAYRRWISAPNGSGYRPNPHSFQTHHLCWYGLRSP
jgi:hypothetical protein